MVTRRDVATLAFKRFGICLIGIWLVCTGGLWSLRAYDQQAVADQSDTLESESLLEDVGFVRG
ncbi:MAG: hypothetical protein GVY16_04365 [Planctomycetes bacterium]|jgi:hypothetical protein|nr:hypothetical protein [Planctomycetota bacterium]